MQNCLSNYNDFNHSMNNNLLKMFGTGRSIPEIVYSVFIGPFILVNFILFVKCFISCRPICVALFLNCIKLVKLLSKSKPLHSFCPLSHNRYHDDTNRKQILAKCWLWCFTSVCSVNSLQFTSSLFWLDIKINHCRLYYWPIGRFCWSNKIVVQVTGGLPTTEIWRLNTIINCYRGLLFLTQFVLL